MRSLMIRLALLWGCTPLLACLVLLQPLAAETMKIVVPNAYEHVDGETYVDVSNFGAFHQQQLYHASEFASLPATHHTITGFYARPDKMVTTGNSASYADLTTRVSITNRNALNSTFAVNHGPEVVTVYDGPLTISTSAGGPAEGPRVFDYYFPFETPFIYDPSEGNLLVELSSNSGPLGELIFDIYEGASTDYVGAKGSTAAVGFPRALGYVNQFVFEKTLLADFNLDLTVNATDLSTWERNYGGPGTHAMGDADGDGLVTGDDFVVWQREYIAGVPGLAGELGVPEPASLLLMLLACSAATGMRKPRANVS